MIKKTNATASVQATFDDHTDVISDKPHLLYKISEVIFGNEITELINLESDDFLFTCNAMDDKHALYVAMFPKNEPNVFLEDIEIKGNIIIENLIQNILLYGVKIWFNELKYELVYKYADGKKTVINHSNMASWYILDEHTINQAEFESILTNSTNYCQVKNDLLSELLAIATVPNYSSRYLLLYEMLCRSFKGQREMDEYILNCGIDTSEITFYAKTDKAPYDAEIRHDNTSHFTVLRNTLAHKKAMLDKHGFLELESDIWSHTRPLINIVILKIVHSK